MPLSEEQRHQFLNTPQTLVDTYWVVNVGDGLNTEYVKIVDVRERRAHVVLTAVHWNFRTEPTHWWVVVESIVWGGVYIGTHQEAGWVISGAMVTTIVATEDELRRTWQIEGVHGNSVWFRDKPSGRDYLLGANCRTHLFLTTYRPATREEHLAYREHLNQFLARPLPSPDSGPIPPESLEPSSPISRISAWDLLKEPHATE